MLLGRGEKKEAQTKEKQALTLNMHIYKNMYIYKYIYEEREGGTLTMMMRDNPSISGEIEGFPS